MRETPTKIAILNFHSKLNSGDLALLEINIMQLKSVFSNAEFTVVTNYPDEFKKFPVQGIKCVSSPMSIVHNLSPQLPFFQVLFFLKGFFLCHLARYFPQLESKFALGEGWRDLIRTIRESSLIASVSGNILLTLGNFGWPFLLSAFQIYLCHLFDKPLYVMPQSIGPLKRNWEKNLVRYLYGKARIIFIRDKISFRLASELGLPSKKLHFSPDPGFIFPRAEQKDALDVLEAYGYHEGDKAVGATVISQLSKSMKKDVIERYKMTLADTLMDFSEQMNAKIFLFDQVIGPSNLENDTQASEEILTMLPESQISVIHIDKSLSPEMLKACYGLMTIFVATRLHSGIFSLGCGVPTVFIGYNPKSRGILDDLSMMDCFIDIDELSHDVLLKKMIYVWNQRLQLNLKIIDAVEACKSEILEVGYKISANYEKR